MQGSRSVADAVVEQLQQFGVEYIFGVSGDAILHLLHSLSKQKQIKFIAVRHESAAGFMASAYAKLTGRLGVCLTTSGPGMANLLNGLGDASADQVPVLAITGQVPTGKIGTHSKQYIDQQRLIEPLAAYSTLICAADAVIPALGRAVATAVKQRTVTHLSFPKDLFAYPLHAKLIPSNPYLYGEAPSQLLNIPQAAQFLGQCQKPMILAGKGAVGCRGELMQIARQLGAGMICTLGAKGVIPESFELMVGGIGEGGSEQAAELLKVCDGLLIVGAMWYPKLFMPPTIPFVQIERETGHIHYDKNLHTALIGDAKHILPELIRQLPEGSATGWPEQVQLARKQWLKQMEKEQGDRSVPLSPAFVMKQLARAADPAAVIALDTGDHTVWFNRSFSTNGQTTVFSGNWRTLGFALPAANAAQLIFPGRQVIAIAGDGGFGMSLGELSTTVANQLPVKIVVLNNSSLAMEKNKMQYMGLTPFGTELHNPHFAMLAQSFGIEGIRVEQPDQLQPALEKMMRKPHPVLLEIITSTQPSPLSKMKAAALV